MKPGMKLSVLSVCLREGTVARRMSPKRYLDGILAIPEGEADGDAARGRLGDATPFLVVLPSTADVHLP